LIPIVRFQNSLIEFVCLLFALKPQNNIHPNPIFADFGKITKFFHPRDRQAWQIRKSSKTNIPAKNYFKLYQPASMLQKVPKLYLETLKLRLIIDFEKNCPQVSLKI